MVVMEYVRRAVVSRFPRWAARLMLGPQGLEMTVNEKVKERLQKIPGLVWNCCEVTRVGGMEGVISQRARTAE